MAPELFDGESRPSEATDIYALGIVIYEVCHIAFSSEPVLKLRGLIPQVLAHKRPFPGVFHSFIPGLVGKRPLRQPNRDILGLSEDVWVLMEMCWDQNPTVRPHIADILTFFEVASHDWTSPTSEAIANLGLDEATSQNSPTTESTFTTFWTAFETAGGDHVDPHEARPSSIPNGTGDIAAA
jgi:serine/threonine protein kinase